MGVAEPDILVHLRCKARIVPVDELVCRHQERWSVWRMLEMISATGFLAIFGWPRLIWLGRQETARFPGDPQQDASSAPRRAPSQ